MILVQQLGLGKTVDGACAGEDKRLNSMAQCGLDKNHALGGVIVHITLGVAHRFADFDIARHMDNRARLMPAQDLF